MLNKTYELLIEGPGPRDSGWLGRTVTNKVVIVKGRCTPGDIVRRRVTRINGWTYYEVLQSVMEQQGVPSREALACN